MSIINTGLGRVPDSLQSSTTMSSISQTQQKLLQIENEIDTGNKINVPSDDPAGAALVQQLQKSISQNSTYASNIQTASSYYSMTDLTLGSVGTEVLAQAQQIASSDASNTTSPTQRASDAQVVQSLVNQMLSLANTKFNGQYIFGGGSNGSAPFVQNGNGIQYIGATQGLSNAFDSSTVLPFTVAGSDAFGVLGGQVTGTALAVGVTGNTNISDLGGQQIAA